MKATAPTLVQDLPLEKSRLAVYAELFKARLTSLVLLTTLVGFYAGVRGPLDGWLMLRALLGMALVAASGSALNQLLEREFDARMRRTRERPLPSGRMQPRPVLAIGIGSACLGLLCLSLAVNLASGVLGAITLAVYLAIYTPLKRLTWLNTAVGAVAGALPPLVGWTAACGRVSGGGLVLFAIQALWQVPHFMAIAWIYRDEYARAGFKMLPVLDPSGRRAARQALAHAAALVPVSLGPFLLGLAGPLYLASALALGLAFAWFALQFARRLTLLRARRLFYASILYLPLLLGALVVEKVKS